MFIQIIALSQFMLITHQLIRPLANDTPDNCRMEEKSLETFDWVYSFEHHTDSISDHVVSDHGLALMGQKADALCWPPEWRKAITWTSQDKICIFFWSSNSVILVIVTIKWMKQIPVSRWPLSTNNLWHADHPLKVLFNEILRI